MNYYAPTKKELYISASAVVAGLIVLVWAVVMVGKNFSILKQEELEAQTATFGVEETYLIKKDIIDLKPDIDLLDSFFVSAGGEVDFIEKLEQVARNSGVKIEINSITVPKKEDESGLVENLNVKMMYEGEWKAIEKFLQAVENMPYAVSLGDIEAELLGGVLWKGKLDLSVLKFKS